MAENGSPPMFNERARRELYERRVLVLDGALDDDNGTLLATSMLALASEDPATDIALLLRAAHSRTSTTAGRARAGDRRRFRRGSPASVRG